MTELTKRELEIIRVAICYMSSNVSDINEVVGTNFTEVEVCDVQRKLLSEDPLFKELMSEGLAMQDCFSAEPVYTKTGKD